MDNWTFLLILQVQSFNFPATTYTHLADQYYKVMTETWYKEPIQSMHPNPGVHTEGAGLLPHCLDTELRP